jgi:hypothetical protein
MVYTRWIVTTDSPRWTHCPLGGDDCLNWRGGLSARPLKTKIVSGCFDFDYGLSGMDIQTVRGWVVARRRARRRQLRTRFWVGFVSMGSWECIELIPSDRFDMHKVFWALGH